MNLIPTYLASYVHSGKWDELKRLNIDDCIECGCCAYVCPAGIPLVQLIRMGKVQMLKEVGK